MCSITDQDIAEWLKKRSRNALPLICIPKADFRLAVARSLHCLSVAILRIQMQGVRRMIRCSRRPEWLAKERKRVNSPENRRRANEREKGRASLLHVKIAKAERAKRYFKKHPERIRAARKTWLENGGREYNRRWFSEKRSTDPHYNIQNRLSSRVWHALASTGVSKCQKTAELIGCSVIELRHHIQRLFQLGMTWEKFMAGEIHIDHKIPCASFDLSDLEEQKRCFHFSNLQPLWAKDNLSKGDSLP